ncbi:glucan 1,3-beta-glucosidase [Chytriomyces cf. hyalinus JEL632]|nr:glucan 1,3-beta-glucosidase [Chytriomyces cf. hyalinus JEL632]
MQLLLFVLSLVGLSHASFWLQDIKHQGVLPFGGDSAYTVFRDVRAYGAMGDGITDDTAAINKAITEGKRCGLGCDSTTATPAIIYFPPGTYLVSAPLIQYYYTFMIGDANQLPTIKAAANFEMKTPWFTYVIDADPYGPGGVNWFVNQNNFFRQIRNLKIDLTGLPATALIGAIHWQVSQATSLQNIEITMAPASPETKQKGIFIENGSGGFFTDIVLNGGDIGMDVGNQQFTTRNIVFNGCNTAVTMSWDWGWVFKSLQINNCGTGVDMSVVNPTSGKQDVGSVILLDCKISNTGVGIKTSFGIANNGSAGSLIVDNVIFDNTPSAVTDSGEVVLFGNTVVKSWGQGFYSDGSSQFPPFRMRGSLDNIEKPAELLDTTGKFFEKSKPQYKDLPASAFLSVKSAGAKGDGSTDDTDAIQNVLNSASSSHVVFFDHGAYLVSRTILVPKGVRIVGEAWPIIMAKGAAFQNPTAPVPVFQVGNVGDVGSVEISDLMFETSGPQPGAILIQFNMKSSSPGATGMWDVHGRVGGTIGSHLQQGECLHGSLNYESCSGPFLMMHITKSAGVYIENSWMWTADHDLDSGGSTRVSIFTGRGVLIESESPVWLYGTAAEHNQMYNYQFSGASNIFAAMLQSETPYYQGTPDALTPFKTNADYNDPDFSNCLPGSKSCVRSWGLRVVQSSNIMIYGAGLYSFFENYAQLCIGTLSCQDNMVSIEASKVTMFNLHTVGTSNMISIDSEPRVPAEPLNATYCSTLAMFVSDARFGKTFQFLTYRQYSHPLLVPQKESVHSG